MILLHLQCYPTPPKLSQEFSKNPTLYPSSSVLLCSSECKLKLRSKASFQCYCTENENTHDHEASSQGFSVLSTDIPWDSGSIWSTMAFYMFILHIPLSFGGLSVVAEILHEPHLDPQTEAVNNPVLKEILLSSNISKATCFLVYCITTPLLEETVYRGFLLRSISATMKWQRAVFISSVIFSAAHFSGDRAFLIGQEMALLMLLYD
ncbi:hypothetical protein CFP56_025634 [Quercus suber]|uniref:CAAX prenyl protease 2/Lysostaphin resistance protein A-like domain-containing protein n=1 Tax=Quercus suber TaxID=58331 RepID=A0AAW0K2C8_QUESU